MDQKNSPEALLATYFNQSKGLLFDLGRIPLVTSPTRERYRQRGYPSASASEDKIPEEKAFKRWVGALRALWGHSPAA
jgi:hypothetical protein